MSVFNSNRIFFCVLFSITGALCLSQPDVEAVIADPTKKPADWNWCAPDAFAPAGLPHPWGNSVVTRGVDISQSRCSDGDETWELYNRYLFRADEVSGVMLKANAEVEHPYFALYNSYTGVLRAFLWGGSNSNISSTGDALVIRFRIVEGENTHPSHLLDMHSSELTPSLQHSPLASEKYWLFENPHNDTWFIIDVPLSYDPMDYNAADGYEKQLFMSFEIELQKTSQFSITGQMKGSIGNSPGSGSTAPTIGDYFKAGKALATVARDGYQNITHAYSSGTELGNDLKAKLSDGQLSWLPDQIENGLYNISSVLSDNSILSGAVSAAVGSVPGLSNGYHLIKSLFVTHSTSTVQYFQGNLDLQGSLFEDNSATSYKIPYSGSVRTRIPYFAYGRKPAMRKLGLFHFTRWPASLNDLQDSFTEPASCLVRMNPNSRSRTVSENSALSVSESVQVYDKGQPVNFVRWKAQQVALSFADPSETDPVKAEQRKVDMVLTLGRTTDWNPLDLFVSSEQSQKDFASTSSACLQNGNSQTPTAPSYLLPPFYALGGTRVTLNDRVQVYSGKDEAGGAVLSHGDLMLGADAGVGELWARGQVELRDRASIQHRLLAGDVSGQNTQTMYLPILEKPGSVEFPGQPVPAKLYDDSPWIGYPSADLTQNCNLYNIEKRPAQPVPVCDKANAGTGIDDYEAFLRADRLAKTPIWCIPAGDGPYYYYRLRAISANPICQQASNYTPISYDDFLKRAIGTRLKLSPGYYDYIIIRSGYTLELTGGDYHIGRLQMESGSLFEIRSNGKPTQIFLYDRLIWRADPGTVEPSQLRISYLGPSQTLLLETSFYGSVFAPRAKLIMGQHTQCVYYGQYYARELEVHQGTVIMNVPFKGE